MQNIIDRFISYISDIRGYSPATVDGYLRDLLKVQSFLSNQRGVDGWMSVTRDDIDAYISYQVSRGMKPATTNRHLSAISSLYGYLRRCGYQVKNPCQYESRRKEPKKVPTTIPLEQLKTAYRESQGIVKAMLAVLITTGCRIGELLEIQGRDIDPISGRTVLRGKGDKERVVFMTKDAVDAIQNAGINNGGKLFKCDQRNARWMIYKALVPYCNAPQLSPHAIRHTFATELATKGVATTTLAAILGHSHIETTQKYVDQTRVDVKSACSIITL